MFVQKYNTPKQYSNLFMSSDDICLIIPCIEENRE